MIKKLIITTVLKLNLSTFRVILSWMKLIKGKLWGSFQFTTV